MSETAVRQCAVCNHKRQQSRSWWCPYHGHQTQSLNEWTGKRVQPTHHHHADDDPDHIEYHGHPNDTARHHHHDGYPDLPDLGTACYADHAQSTVGRGRRYD